MTYTRLSPKFQPKSAFWPRRQFLGTLLATCSGTLACGLIPAYAGAQLFPASQPVRQLAPSMTSKIIDNLGAEFSLYSLKGRPVLINFWATWCPPCVHELPALERAAQALHGDIKILLVSVDRGGLEKAQPVLTKLGVKTPDLGFDSKSVLSREMGVRGLPTSFLLSADQTASWTYVGPREWDKPEMLDEMRGLAMKHSPNISPSLKNLVTAT